MVRISPLKGNFSMRIFVAGLLAASLVTASAYAADAPLPAGQAAGAKAAQQSDNTLLYVFGGAAIAAGALILSNGDSDSKVTPGTTPLGTTGT